MGYQRQLNNIEEYLEYVKYLDSYSDEIPEEILHSSMVVDGKEVHPKFKCRKGWFAALYATIDLGSGAGYIGNNIRDMFEDFEKYADETDFRKRLTVREDIDRANKILTAIIDEFKG